MLILRINWGRVVIAHGGCAASSRPAQNFGGNLWIDGMHPLSLCGAPTLAADRVLSRGASVQCSAVHFCQLDLFQPALLGRGRHAGFDMWVIDVVFWGLVLSCTAETDWLLFRDAEINSGHLRKDFSGRILDAGCSSSSDKETIHHEVLQSGKMHEVEEAVRVLLQMNVVTNELQRTAAVVGKLGDASRFSRFFFFISVGLFAWM